ncbi:hypothetical protein ABKV58_12810 [Enterobacter bugandensis]|nr:hypothetical protein [Enterobacter bugandensis]
MSVQNNITGGESVVLERPAAGGVYASLFEKINLSPVTELSALDMRPEQAVGASFPPRAKEDDVIRQLERMLEPYRSQPAPVLLQRRRTTSLRHA